MDSENNSEEIAYILDRGAIPKYNEAKYNEGKPEKALRVNDVIKYATTDKDFTKVKGSLEECWRIAQDNGTVKLYVERPKVTTAQFEHSRLHELGFESFDVLRGHFS